MSKHTKGPWLQVADRDEIIIYANSGPKGDDPICFTSDSRPIEEIQANARLIAAAPELLEALIKAEQWIDAQITTANEISNHDRKVAREATDAIKKALEG